ncbi:glutathione S-transferase C-terminal domain-containing protein homolog [Rhipicephalus microplus]|uniref:glutathione S-transferase C-terminal domain-containing protein homolog n=1 Tax=Rhipicephalus microplus TaxID=6941 RepID=UPI003F6D99A3
MAIEPLVMLGGRKDNDTSLLRVPQSTLVALFTFAYCEIEDLRIVLVPREPAGDGGSDCNDNPLFDLPLSVLSKLKCFETSDGSPTPQELLDCEPPAVYLPDNTTATCIGGLAGVLRWALGQFGSRTRDRECKALLGFRGGCLAACSESSLWTRFCELDVQRAIPKLRKRFSAGSGFESPPLKLPEELHLLEAHMRQPVKTHNVRRKQQQVFRASRREGGGSPVEHKPVDGKLPLLEHRFVEGFDQTLADVVLFPVLHLIFTELAAVTSKKAISVRLPLTTKWYETMSAQIQTHRALESLELKHIEQVEREECSRFIEEFELPKDSLYSSHPERTKPRIRHKNPESIINSLREARISPDLKPNPGKDSLPLPWEEFPEKVHPLGGGLPKNRVLRKCQQIENLVVLALQNAFDGCTIVDFCSGGGHVGIVLAYLLPECRIVMIENKEESMHRARERVKSLGLRNVVFYQSNIDYYVGDFDLGVSLHACGVATDLVLQKCIERNAAFMSCPCCYGAMKVTDRISYPLSRAFRDTGISKEDYTLLCHYADRTERDTPTCQQGHYCMALVDRDRAMCAAESGYEVIVTQMVPHDCSPKGLVLVGKRTSKVR